MALKRRLCEDEIGEAENKRAKIEEGRFSNLPDDLKLHILSSLNTKDAFKATMLSKTWVSLWSWIPVLDFDEYDFHNSDVFENFVDRVLCLRHPSAKLDKLKFTPCGISSAKVLKDVSSYAFSHGVKQLEAHICEANNSRKVTWPICLNASFESLTNLKLENWTSMSCPLLGPRSGSFKNLTDLYLKRAIITDHDPFSGFPEMLTLVNCDIKTEDETLSVHAHNLSELTISGYQIYKCCELTTPRLKFFEYRGGGFFPLFRRHEDLRVLDTMVIRYSSYLPHDNKMFDSLFSLFCTLDNVKSLELFWSTAEILSSFHEDLVKRSSSFRKLKCLKLHFGYEFARLLNSTKIAADVKSYLLQNSPDVQVIYI